MAKFCPECANPILDGEKLFCTKCGAKLPITSSDVQSPITRPIVRQPPGVPSQIQSGSKEPTIPSVQKSLQQKQDPTTENTKKTTSVIEQSTNCCSNNTYVGIAFLILIFFFVLAYALTGHIGNDSFSSSDVNKDVIITKDLSSIALTINDLPTGWKTFGDAEISKEKYSSKFVRVEGLTPYFVYLDITRNSTIDQAKTEYTSKQAEITQYKVESVNIGDEGFGYVTEGSSIVEFRKGNIIVRTQYGVGGFGGSFSSLSINDAKTYADIVAGRI